ncbi:MAG: hypothetical protein LBB07_00490 [Bifidobacteriaceae bacterium]|jgi:DNA polymerase-1|nr:hypothetical protein [Bifidobacteriaceae bacterium]
MGQKLLIIDSHYLAYRSYYGLDSAHFYSPSGQRTNAVFGFAKTFFNIVSQLEPTHIAAAYDKTKKTFRHNTYPEYKGERKPTPDDLRSQFPYIYKLLDAFSISPIGIDDFEADDIIATLSRMSTMENMETYIVSGDRDTLQLVNKNVTVLLPQNKTSDLKYMTPDAVSEKYNVTPGQYSDLAAIVGESSDNIKGAPGIGPIGAAKLINEYGSLENILQAAPTIDTKAGKALAECTERIRMNRSINRLVNDVKIDYSLNDLKIKSPDARKTLDLYNELGFGKGLRVKFCQYAKNVDPELDLSNFEIDNEELEGQNLQNPEAANTDQGTLF